MNKINWIDKKYKCIGLIGNKVIANIEIFKNNSNYTIFYKNIISFVPNCKTNDINKIKSIIEKEYKKYDEYKEFLSKV